MADAKRTIELVFEGVDNTGAAVQSALRNTGNLTDGMQSVTQPFADVTAAALKFEAAILATGAAVTAFSVTAAADFQSAAIDLQKVLGENESVDAFKDQALELSSAYGVAAKDVLSSIADFKQAGFTAEEAAQLTKASLDLVIAGGIDAEQASLGLVAALKGFGSEASQSANIVDLLNAVSNEYGATVAQLLEGFSTLSPVARTAGLSLEATIGVLTPGIEVFQSGSEVANSLRTAFLRLQDDSQPVTDALEALGVSQKNANGELRSGRDIFFEVAQALRETDDSQQTYLASQLVGIQRTSQFLAVVNGLDTALRISGDGFQFAGSAAKEVEAQLAGFESTIDRLQEGFRNLGIAIGTPLLDDLGGVAEGVSAIFSAIGESLDAGALSEITDFIEAEFTNLAVTLEGIAAALPDALSQADLTGFIDGLEAVRDAVTGLFDGLDLTDANDLARAITFVGESFEGLSRFSAGVIESFQPLFQFFAGLAERASEGAESLDSLGRAFGIASQVNLFAGAVAGVVPVLEALLAILVVKQGVGLVGALGSLAGKLGGQTGVVALLGRLSAVGAAGGAGFALGKLADEATRTATGTGLSDRLSDWLTTFTDLNAQAERLVETTVPSADAQAAAIREADEAMQSFSGNIDQAVDFWGEFGSESGRVTATLQSYGDAAAAASESTEKLGADGQALTGYFSVVESGARGVASALDELSGLSDALQVELAIANLESQTEIAVAGLEADAKKTVAAFDSISVSVQSTGDAITDLFGLLGDGNISKLDKIDLRKQLDEENDRRQESFDLQKKLTDAQIDEARARVAALSRGDALIKVNGDGLAPHLEAFMWEVLEAIQVRVNAQGYEMLLGAGA